MKWFSKASHTDYFSREEQKLECTWGGELQVLQCSGNDFLFRRILGFPYVWSILVCYQSPPKKAEERLKQKDIDFSRWLHDFFPCSYLIQILRNTPCTTWYNQPLHEDSKPPIPVGSCLHPLLDISRWFNSTWTLGSCSPLEKFNIYLHRAKPIYHNQIYFLKT